MDRREMIKLTAAGLAGAAVYKGAEEFGLPQSWAAPATSVDAGKLNEAHKALGKWILLSPQKLGGGTHAVDLSTGRGLAWISYWNYGDTCPISHHLAAYPSEDPYKGFEFINSTQGGENILIYGLPTRIKQMGLLKRTGEGNHMYRVRYDGQQMELVEDVAETTGIGLGVHTMIYPDANGFSCSDGQKDICAFFDRPKGNDKTKVLMAFRADWEAKNKDSLEQCWQGGGTLRLTRLVQPKESGKYEYEGSAGNKINWEMVPMAELLVERGQIPGASPQTLTGLDATVHHPGNRYTALINRMAACAIILDRTTWEPVTCLHTPEGSPGNLPIKKVASAPDVWEIKFDDVKNPARGRVLARRQVVRHDEQPSSEQHGGLRHLLRRSSPMEEGYVCQGSRLGRRVSLALPSLFLDGRLEDVRLRIASKAGQKRNRGRRHE